MICKTIKYTDYNGVEREEDFWFNISKTELSRMQFSKDGSFADKLRDIVRAKDTVEMMNIFEWIILKSYGEKSPDGKRFIKSEEAAKAFTQTPAYDELYFDLISDSTKFADFVNGIIPPDLAKDVDKINPEEYGISLPKPKE